MTALGSRSSSVERNSVTGATQPFVGETCKVPLSVPNTLEEARRRLEDDVRARTKQRLVIYYAVSEVSPYKSTNKRFCTLSVLNKKTLNVGFSGRPQVVTIPIWRRAVNLR